MVSSLPLLHSLVLLISRVAQYVGKEASPWVTNKVLRALVCQGSYMEPSAAHGTGGTPAALD